jgi:acetyltransferase-like isoleucine patch superfamily enzyme
MLFRNYLKRIINLGPFGMRHFGRGSFILMPRRLIGATYMTIGASVSIDRHSWLAAYGEYAGYAYTPRIMIGDHVTIGRHACITAINRIEIGSNCLLSEQVYISDHSHGNDPLSGPAVRQPLVSKGPVIIGDDTFIGYRACILPGVTLGRNCVVGANAVVTRSFPDFSMVAGAPARIIKRYSAEKVQWISA